MLGPRRVGKTTALYQTVRPLIAEGVEPGRTWWLRLDHPLLLQENLGDLVRAVLDTSHATPDVPVLLMLDELVYTDRWELLLKTFFDEQWPVRIAATSSATAAHGERRLESGVGRWSEQHLTPYLSTEFLALVGQDRPVEVGDTLADSLARLRHGQRADRSQPARPRPGQPAAPAEGDEALRVEPPPGHPVTGPVGPRLGVGRLRIRRPSGRLLLTGFGLDGSPPGSGRGGLTNHSRGFAPWLGTWFRPASLIAPPPSTPSSLPRRDLPPRSATGRRGGC